MKCTRAQNYLIKLAPWTTSWFRISFWKWREVAQCYVEKFKYENSRLLSIVHSCLLFTCLNTQPILTFSRMMLCHLERLKEGPEYVPNYQVPNGFFGYNYGYASQNGSLWIDNKKRCMRIEEVGSFFAWSQ